MAADAHTSGTPLAAIVLAAGRSRRMRSSTPKVLHTVLGVPLVELVVRAAKSVGTERVVLVTAPSHREEIAAALGDRAELSLATQEQPRGTADAVLAARAELEGFTGTALVLLGDTPYIDSTDLERQRRRYREFWSIPELRPLAASVPVYATWDDHDFATNDTVGAQPGRERSRRAFVEYHPQP